MQNVKLKAAVPIKVKLNTNSQRSDQWAQIVHDIPNGQVLHTGQVKYIRSVAKRKYNVLTSI